MIVSTLKLTFMTNKLGRPFLPKNKVRSVLLAVKISPAESAQIDKAAKRSKQEKPEWVRNTLLSASQTN